MDDELRRTGRVSLMVGRFGGGMKVGSQCA